MFTSLRAVLVPDGVVERVERDLEVAAPIFFPVPEAALPRC
jgi:hypothetical protein